MTTPTVSFVVPCYKLAHLLSDCVGSILAQTYSDFEVLIMDDCSPDNTAEVASSLKDPRVQYVRNEANLGHIRNYNKGIQMSRGRYVWLISADDRLRRSYLLERYVNLMDRNPRVGYVFCPGVGLRNGVETRLLRSHAYGKEDRIFSGREFITMVLSKFGGLLTPSVMVRRDCYEKVSMFPVEMPHQGDMYLWFIWALEYDVAYLAEPMVNYRDHELNMMKDFVARIPQTVFTDEVNVLWRTKRRSEQMGFGVLAHDLDYFIARKYAQAAEFALYGEGSVWGMSVKECEDALRANADSEQESGDLLQKFHSLMADRHRAHGAFANARRSTSIAGEYGISRNLVVEVLHSHDWKHTERWKVADLRLSAARIYWCQGKKSLGMLYGGYAFITRPTMVVRPLRRILRLFRSVPAHASF